MGHQTIRWVANDGQEFLEERDMILHELEAIDAKEAAAFCEEHYSNSKKRKEYIAVILAWQKYQRQGQTDVEVVNQGFNSRTFGLPDSALSVEDVFAQVPQGRQVQRPENYELDEDAAIEESFKRAMKI